MMGEDHRSLGRRKEKALRQRKGGLKNEMTDQRDQHTGTKGERHNKGS